MLGKFEELLLLLIIILVLFGAKKLPELSKAISESIREVRKGFRGDDATKSDQEAATKTRPRV